MGGKRGREGGERGREGRKGREGGRKGKREGGREGGRERREGEGKGGREGGRGGHGDTVEDLPHFQDSSYMDGNQSLSNSQYGHPMDIIGTNSVDSFIRCDDFTSSLVLHPVQCACELVYCEVGGLVGEG